MSIIANIEKVITDKKDLNACYDLFALSCDSKDDKESQKALLWLSRFCERVIKEESGSLVEKAFYLHEDVLKQAAVFDFESYLLFTEWNRAYNKQFYRPRRKQLKFVCQALQELEEDKYDLLTISMPPGVGKTTLALFYLTWLAGKYPNMGNLVGSHNGDFIRGCYEECLNMTSPNSEYRWHDVFPGISLVKSDAKACRIDFDERCARRETMQFTTVGSGNAGLYRATKLLYCDDLVSGREVATNKEQLEKLWNVYTTDLQQRKIGDLVKELHIATRWSVYDVIGRLENHHANSDRARFITMPAWDKNENSLWDYKDAPGYTTKKLHDLHDTMNEVDWNALYMNEPVEREGLLYPKEELRYYYELPKDEKGEILEPDTIIGICDTKDRGEDYAFLPVVYVYGDDYYIEDCICDNGLPKVVDVRLADMLLRRKVKACRFESNNSGNKTAEKVQTILEKSNGITHITTRYTTSNKIAKILTNSDWVQNHCIFKSRDCYKPNSDYGRMMKMLTSFTMSGKNAHDDVPDGLAMLASFAQSFQTNVKIINRPW